MVVVVVALVGVDLGVDAGTVDGGADGLVKSISGSLVTTLAVTMGGVSTSEQMITRGRCETKHRVDGNEVGLNVIATEIWNRHFTFHIYLPPLTVILSVSVSLTK
jgi:hypothetical protein